MKNIDELSKIVGSLTFLKCQKGTLGNQSTLILALYFGHTFDHIPEWRPACVSSVSKIMWDGYTSKETEDIKDRF